MKEYATCKHCRFHTRNYEKLNTMVKWEGIREVQEVYREAIFCNVCIAEKGETFLLQYLRGEVETQPVEVTIDTVRTLRRRGLGNEAEEMLKRFRADVDNNKKELQKSIKKKDYEIKKMLRKKHNLCRVCGQVEVDEENKHCEECKAKQNVLKEREKIRNAFLRGKTHGKNEEKQHNEQDGSDKTANNTNTN